MLQVSALTEPLVLFASDHDTLQRRSKSLLHNFARRRTAIKKVFPEESYESQISDGTSLVKDWEADKM